MIINFDYITNANEVDIDLSKRCQVRCTSFELDEEYRTMSCSKCGRMVEPFDYLVEVTINRKEAWEASKKQIDRMNSILEQLHKEIIERRKVLGSLEQQIFKGVHYGK